MKNYNVTIETKDGQISSAFQIEAKHLKEAKKTANFIKRHESKKGKTSVRLCR